MSLTNFHLLRPGQIFFYDHSPWLRLHESIVSFHDIPREEDDLEPDQKIWTVDADFYYDKACIARTFDSNYVINLNRHEFNEYIQFCPEIELGMGDFYMSSELRIYFLIRDTLAVDVESGEAANIMHHTTHLLPLGVEIFFYGRSLWNTPNI